MIEHLGNNLDPSSNTPLDELEDTEVSPRDEGILRAIQDEGLTVFTFYGLRRLLGVHQETLSRILGRLEGEGLVERVPEGYKVTARGEEYVPQHLASPAQRIPIIQSLLPEDLHVDRIVSGLKGHWFGNLRWLGYVQNDEGLVLKWITDEDSVQIDARFTDTLLTIEARVPEGKSVGGAVKASHQLLGHISRLYRAPKRPGTFATPVAFYPALSFDWRVTNS